MEVNAQEIVGYAASALVVLSLTMTSVVRLRLISLVGSVTFVAYGLLIESVPIVITNASIAVINVWFLSRELGGRRDLGVVLVPPDSPFLLDFLAHHTGDIVKSQPDYDPAEPPDFALVLTREGLPAGVLLGRRVDRTLDITLDYVIKAYRDSRVGRWLFDAGVGVFRSSGIDRLTATGRTDVHRGYLRRVGFVLDEASGAFVLEL